MVSWSKFIDSCRILHYMHLNCRMVKLVGNWLNLCAKNIWQIKSNTIIKNGVDHVVLLLFRVYADQTGSCARGGSDGSAHESIFKNRKIIIFT
jgi:hypothetical protein